MYGGIDMDKKRVGIITGIIIILILVIGLVVYSFVGRKEEKKQENTTVKHETAEKLYKGQDGETCTEVTIVSHNAKASETDDKVLLYLIFGQMKKDKVLGNEITKDDYMKSAEKILKNEDIPEAFEDYVYEGYAYELNGNQLTRKKVKCDSKKYVSKLYGYSNNEETLTLNVKAGYIENNQVYDLNGTALGAYSADTLNEMLDKGTLQVYTYQTQGGKYQLESVSVK